MNALHSLCSYVHSTCFLYQGQFYFVQLAGEMLNTSAELGYLSYIHMWIQEHRTEQHDIHIFELYHAFTHDNIERLYYALRQHSELYANMISTTSDLMWMLTSEPFFESHEVPIYM